MACGVMVADPDSGKPLRQYSIQHRCAVELLCKAMSGEGRPTTASTSTRSHYRD